MRVDQTHELDGIPAAEVHPGVFVDAFGGAHSAPMLFLRGVAVTERGGESFEVSDATLANAAIVRDALAIMETVL